VTEFTDTPLQIASDHPAFAGHFPGSPIVPGAILLDEAMFAIAAATSVAHRRVSWVKFLRPVRPADPLLIRHAIDANGSIRFEILSGTDRVVRGNLLAVVPP